MPVSSHDFLTGGGDTGSLIRSIDWSNTSVGPVETWPQSLRTAVSIVMESRFPMYIAWGADYTQFYNDGYRPILGSTKHPAAMGLGASETFAESWHIIGPMFDGVMAGTAVGAEDWMLPLDRHGYLEECYFTFSYGPIRAEDGLVAGVHVTVTETTERVLNERRLRTLRDVATSAAEAQLEEHAWAGATRALSQNIEDLPFALLYALDADGVAASLVGSTMGAAGTFVASRVVLGHDAGWPLGAVAAENQPRLVTDVGARFGAVIGPKWPEPVEAALVLPVARPGLPAPYGFLIVGVSPRRALDAQYREFLVMLADHIATAIANSRTMAEEKQRSEALAEIDRAKTAFFSNISHEFRTPLTLMLGPQEDALESPAGVLSGADLQAVHRNTLRLLKLVNSLLDFARVQAGRATAVYEPTDLAALTSDLASAFRSAIERGGVRFEVDCPPLPEPIFVDREMWEKIILNLLSNAFKFTFEGTIRISQRLVGEHVVVDVQDSGTGIPEVEMPRLFERFHRVEGAKARTQEGSGIGLALVQDLVRLHGGTIDATSVVGQGTTFRIEVPRGSAHLRATHIVPESKPRDAENTAKPFVVEALRWVPTGPPETATPGDGTARQGHLLIADDNADMREYLARLLGQHWSIEAVADGEQAVAAVKSRRPDLVITDLMMPNLDGVGVLRALRANDSTKDLPIIALSARAGEEARVEGLRAGFSDYVVKPFSARELVVRVEAQLARAEVRAIEELHARRLRNVFENAPVGIAILRGPEHVFEFANASYSSLVDRRVMGRSIRGAFPDLEGQGVFEMLDGVFTTGEPFITRSRRLLLVRQDDPIPQERFFDWVYQPMRGDHGAVDGIVVVVYEVTELASARRQAESANRAKDEFMAILGHELRNPLAPILTAIELMRLRDDPAFEKERSVIERQAQHLVRLVDDLLDVSRITTGKVELKAERVQVGHVIAKAMEMASPILEQRRHRVTVDVPARGLAVDGDPGRLAQVLANLLTNAAKYTEPGGSVTVTAGRDGDQIVIRVRDTGIGISAEMLPRVFDLFAQERQALDRALGGLGLGLSIVKSLVTMHGGHVAASSEGHGLGSEFVVVLPAATSGGVEASVGNPQPSLIASESTIRRRVLVVDDNVDAAELLAESLELMGYTTRVAHDGPGALLIAEEFQPEVALLDIGLPAMDGYELARLLRARPTLTRVCLVAVTGYGQETDRHAAHEAGFNAHLVKPVDLEGLRSLMRQMTFSTTS